MENKKYFWIILLFAMILLHLNFIIPKAITSLYYGDEVVFIECAKNLVTGDGLTIIQGQTQEISSCLWHPPLYILSMGLVMSIFGESSLALRSISIIFNLFVIILVYLITKELLKTNKNKEIFALIAAGIYALNPLTIQSSIILDIDGGLLNFLMLLFVFIYIKADKYKYWLLSLVLFLIFWTKLTGIIFLFGSFFLFLLISRDYKRLLKLIGAFIGAGLIFLISFFSYCWFFGLNFLMPFTHSSIIGYFLLLIENPVMHITRAAWMLRMFTYFVTPFLLLLFIFSIVYLFIKKEKKLLPIILVPVLVILLFMITAPTAWNFPKYHILSIAYISIVVTYSFSKSFKKIEIDNKFWIRLIITSLLIICFFVVFIGDPIIPRISGTTSTLSISDALGLELPLFLTCFFVPLLLSLILWKKFPNGRKVVYTLLYLVILMFVYINFIQLIASYSAYNLYGNSGLRGTLDYIQENEIKAESIVTYSHIGYYIGFSEFSDIMFVYNSPEAFENLILENDKIKYVIMLEKDIKRIGENMNQLEFNKRIGDYFIYKK